MMSPFVQVILGGLLTLANVIGALVWFDIQDLRKFVRETRKKLDGHVENFDLHGLRRGE